MTKTNGLFFSLGFSEGNVFEVIFVFLFQSTQALGKMNTECLIGRGSRSLPLSRADLAWIRHLQHLQVLFYSYISAY